VVVIVWDGKGGKKKGGRRGGGRRKEGRRKEEGKKEVKFKTQVSWRLISLCGTSYR
jgi:hypothetical protein